MGYTPTPPWPTPTLSKTTRFGGSYHTKAETGDECQYSFERIFTPPVNLDFKQYALRLEGLHACRELLTGGKNLKSRPIEAEDVMRVVDGKVPSDPTVVSQYT